AQLRIVILDAAHLAPDAAGLDGLQQGRAVAPPLGPGPQDRLALLVVVEQVDVAQLLGMPLQLAGEGVVLEQAGLQQPVTIGHRGAVEGRDLVLGPEGNEMFAHGQAPWARGRAAAPAAARAPEIQPAGRVSQALMISRRRPTLPAKRRTWAGA